MLQAIRSKAGSLVVKILFALLILSFGVWGIGDIFRQRTAAETTVATVGDLKIQADELQTILQPQLQRARSVFGADFGPEQAKQLGLVDSALQTAIRRGLLDLETQRLGLAIDEQVVRQAVLNDPGFKNSTGVFDRNLFYRILSDNRLDEARYAALLRRDLARSEVVASVTSGATAPALLVDPLYKTRNEKRVADTVFIAGDKVPGIAEPSEADLQAYHDSHESLFRAPEYRGFTALLITPEDFVGRVEVPEAQLREDYQSRIASYTTPDRREIEQFILPDEAKAKEAEAALAQGKDFESVAKDLANQSGDTIKLGWVTRDELGLNLPALVDTVFALKQGETSKPVQSPLGWHIIKVAGVENGSVKSFEEVKDELASAAAREIAGDKLYKLANQVQDQLAGGATIEQTAEKLNLKPLQIAAIDADGKDKEGKPVDIPAAAEIVRAAFKAEKDRTTELVQTEGNGYFALRVDSVTPSVVQPLAAVEGRAKELFLAEKRNAAAEAAAKEMQAAVAAGSSLADLAKAKGLEVTTSPPVLRTGAGGTLPASLVAQLFGLKPGGIAAGAGANGWYVAQLKSIDLPDPAADKLAVDSVGKQIQQSLRDDLLIQFEKALRGRFPVEIHQQELDRVL
jgi:peptidyl-prolyl cis-trans isomerase D